MDVEDLIESMRSAGYFSLDDLDYAIFESNGKLSAMEKRANNAAKHPCPYCSCAKEKQFITTLN